MRSTAGHRQRYRLVHRWIALAATPTLTPALILPSPRLPDRWLAVLGAEGGDNVEIGELVPVQLPPKVISRWQPIEARSQQARWQRPRPSRAGT